jgi:hypothetical protein
MKYTHELRDPVHAFVRLDSDERRVLDSRAFQRLRNIHQLAMTYLVYPGATHKRFEHSIGVMELAGRVYDVITDPENISHPSVREIMPPYDSITHHYWRKIVRMAALCHDIGHLPFSHAAEHELLPDGVSHEDLTVRLIRSAEMTEIWSSMQPPLNVDHIVKLAVGQKILKELNGRFPPIAAPRIGQRDVRFRGAPPCDRTTAMGAIQPEANAKFGRKRNVCFPVATYEGADTHYQIWVGSLPPLVPFTEPLQNGVT